MDVILVVCLSFLKIDFKIIKKINIVFFISKFKNIVNNLNKTSKSRHNIS